jgi:hypothetical protein
MKVFLLYTTKSPTITLHFHGKNMTLINGSLFSLLSTLLQFSCKGTCTSTKTKTKIITKKEIFNQDSLPLSQSLTLLFTSILTYLLHHCMEMSPSLEATWFSASQEVPWPLWNLKVHYLIRKCLPPVPVLSIWTCYLPNVTVLSSALRLLICVMLEAFLSQNEFPLLQQNPHRNSTSIYY